jgi:hypothetical protein
MAISDNSGSWTQVIAIGAALGNDGSADIMNFFHQKSDVC